MYVLPLFGYCSSAIDVETGQRVAVKKLARPFQQTPVHAKRAYREIKLMKLLTKTNTNVLTHSHTHTLAS